MHSGVRAISAHVLNGMMGSNQFKILKEDNKFLNVYYRWKLQLQINIAKDEVRRKEYTSKLCLEQGTESIVLQT